MDVSLNGNILTVSVDGHSDDVDLSLITPLSGTIELRSDANIRGSYPSSSYFNRMVQYQIADITRGTLNAGNLQISGIVDFTEYTRTSSYHYSAPYTIFNDSLINLIGQYALSGSGTITINCRADFGSGSYVDGTSPLSKLIIKVQSGNITNVSLEGGPYYYTNYSSFEANDNYSISVDIGIYTISVS